MNNQPKQPNFLWKCVKALRPEIKYGFLFFSVMLLLIELLFKRWQAPSLVFFTLGDIFLKLCYSFVASVIFYYINVQIPKEIKREKAEPMIIHNLKVMAKETFMALMTISSRDMLVANKVNYDHFLNRLSNLDPKANPKFFATSEGEGYNNDRFVSTWLEFFLNAMNKVEHNCKYVFSLHEFTSSEAMLICNDCYVTSERLKWAVTINHLNADVPNLLLKIHEQLFKIDELLAKEYNSYLNFLKKDEFTFFVKVSDSSNSTYSKLEEDLKKHFQIPDIKLVNISKTVAEITLYTAISDSTVKNLIDTFPYPKAEFK